MKKCYSHIKQFYLFINNFCYTLMCSCMFFHPILFQILYIFLKKSKIKIKNSSIDVSI